MSYKTLFDLNMNKWDYGFEPIKPGVEVDQQPFIEIAVNLLHTACELNLVKGYNYRASYPCAWYGADQ